MPVTAIMLSLVILLPVLMAFSNTSEVITTTSLYKHLSSEVQTSVYCCSGSYPAGYGCVKHRLNYTIVVTMTKIGTLTATNMVLQFAVTQSHISQIWQGQTHLEHVNRLMFPMPTEPR